MEADDGHRYTRDRYSRDRLIAQSGIDFIQLALGRGHTRHHAQVVRCILLRNILSGRLARQMHKQCVADETAWLFRYIQALGACYQQERDRWKRMQSPEMYQALYDRLLSFARNHAFHLRALGYNVDACEVASEAFMLSDQRLRRYPFDLPLDRWLDRHVRQCAERLCSSDGRGIVVLSTDEIDDDRIPDVSVGCNSLAWDESIDLAQGIACLDARNRAVLALWVRGASLRETSRALHLTEKAVSNRRARIRERLFNWMGDASLSKAA
ncbi:MAG: hypothetical protein M1546_24405 [Chloroflexi bacterium]|nr:hypothetical protein [Chloroflexota bacterium]